VLEWSFEQRHEEVAQWKRLRAGLVTAAEYMAGATETAIFGHLEEFLVFSVSP